LQIGCSVSGIIDGKFDNGYLVTVNLGTNQLKGVLYHIPHTFHESQDSRSSDLPPRRRRKRSRLALRDPSQPKSNRSGYNFFFTEHYAQLKPLHHGQEKVISKKIGLLWNNLTEAEKQVSEIVYIWVSQLFSVLHSLLFLWCRFIRRKVWGTRRNTGMKCWSTDLHMLNSLHAHLGASTFFYFLL